MKSRIATTMVLAAGLALAGCSKEDPTGFPKVDYNKDGRVIFEELIVIFPDLTVEEFLAADADGNGTLSDREYGRFRDARTAGKKLDAAAVPAAPAAKPAEAPAAKPAEPTAPAPAKAAEPAPAAAIPAPAAPVTEVVETVVAEPPAPAPAPAPTAPAAAKPAPAAEKPASTATKPAVGADKPVAAGGATHTVARGDTLTRLAKKYGVSAQAIMEANGMKNADQLQLGKTLTIPAPAQ
ncbi:LysM peptidoglycan-binding domain-containing protein [Solidesulfovibrio magneticus]|uniref:LysM domain-containing protein n=1 Tax=Solidesulfovibrio magneticus (strain ATCC 700980 / DSM 13731 / RS-1) TaxID=573370 RepID=C4XI77_SOLM1|nr:LysM domain-containing protein [Solidesulfovibrio magneticus]BAH74039.1 hypothetical protein DMR_05480 [Solidesulfovibrio magneticus RS-1]